MNPLRFPTPLVSIVFLALLISPIFSITFVNKPVFLTNGEAPSWRRFGTSIPMPLTPVRYGQFFLYVPSAVSASVDSSVKPSESGAFTYRYRITNTGRTHISSIGFAATTPFEKTPTPLGTYAQFGYHWWQFSNKTNVETRYFDIADGDRSGRVPMADFGLGPGQSIELILVSRVPPGFVDLAVRGNGWVFDVSQNQTVPAPQDYAVEGLVIGPNPDIVRSTSSSYMNYILTLSAGPSAQASPLILSQLSRLKASIGTPGHLDVCHAVLSELGADESELGQVLRVNLAVYIKQFMEKERVKSQ